MQALLPYTRVRRTSITKCYVRHRAANGNGKSQSKRKRKVYDFNDMHRVVVLAVGISLGLYPGLVHPGEDDDDQQASAASLKTLKKLLTCTSDVNLNETSSYHRHLGLTVRIRALT